MAGFSKLFSVGAVAAAITSGCAGYAQVATTDAESFFAYQSVNLINTYIGIGTGSGSDTGYVTLSDAYVEGGAGIRDQQYFATSEQIGLHFAYPLNGAKTGSEWQFDSCNYSVVEQIEHDSSAESTVYLQLIEARCDDLEHVTRFLYSTSRGLLSISFGDLKTDNVFDLHQSFFLMGTGLGFGSKEAG